ncbi:MAG TPA: hypothetical protein VM370_07555 [Candidatus Thermoplasmatota archaeon]|nr:hypothetical protein [Candidatus Thermoplasmatota archaeon]
MRLVVPMILLLVAGCIDVPDATVEPATTLGRGAAGDAFNGLGDPLLHGEGHSHADLAAHRLATPSMTMLARETFASLGISGPAFGEIDLLGDHYAVVADLLAGFYVLDVSDPEHPVPVSFTPDAGYIADVKASESGDFVFLGIQLAGFTGVHVFNVAVPERPVFTGAFPIVGTAPFEGGCHMIEVHGSYLYCAPNDATVRIFSITETPVTAILTPVGAYAPQGAPPAPVLAPAAAGDEFTHDMTVQDDPVTGEPVMFVSFWDYGVRVVDVSDPSSPRELGGWTGEGAEDWGTYGGNLHTSMAGLINGKRVVVTIPEYAEVPSVTLLDASDYGAMTALGVWAPHTAEELDGEASTFSMHNFQLVGSTIYLAMYHGGVWVLDASEPTHPVPVGYFLPSEGASTSVPVPIFSGGGQSVWDVVVKDGVILATDITGGLYALQYAPDAGAVGLTSFA